MRITFVGAGYVGLTTAAVFASLDYEVFILDTDESKIQLIKSGKVPFFEPGLEEIVARTVKNNKLTPTTSYEKSIPRSDVVFICVGTPSKKGKGETKLSYVFSASAEVGENLEDKYTVIIVKSTVPPGTTELVGDVITKISRKKQGRDFDVVSSPEFLAEGSALKDTFKPSRIVVGHNSEKPTGIIKKLFKPFKSPLLFCDLRSAELMKYASNAFLATKISYINEIALIAERVGADVTKVAESMGFDERIGPKFLEAGLGFGGSCFPKDVEALLSFSDHSGYEFGVLRAANDVNLRQHKRFVEKIAQKLGGLKNKRVALLGLSFKPNTDDMRKAVSVEIIKALLDKGALVTTYDPLATEKAKTIFNEEEKINDTNLKFSKNVYEALKGADCLALITEWDDFKKLDWRRIKKLMKGRLIADGRNLFDPEKVKKLGFDYFGVGR